MIITIFGSTGNVGKQLVNQAILNGHTVRAFGRSVFTAGFREHENLEIIQGALFEESEVAAAVKGSDVVLAAIGGAMDGQDKSRSLGMRKIVEAMENGGVSRIVAVGGIGVLNSEVEGGKLIMEEKGFPAEYLAVSEEHLSVYNTLKASSLKWTLVCPPMIVNGEPTGSFHTKANAVPTLCSQKINSGDLCLFMLSEMTANEFVYEAVGICNG